MNHNLIKRPNSPYWFLFFRLNGKQIQRSTKETKKSLAHIKARQMMLEIVTQKEDPNNHSFNDAVDRYLTQTAPHKNTKRYIQWLSEKIGALDINEITGDTLWELGEDYAKEKAPIKGQSVNRAMKPLYAILYQCKVWGWTENQFIHIKRPTLTPKKRDPLSEEEVNRLLNACTTTGIDWLYDPLHFYLLTGLRKDELKQLKKRDISENVSVMRIVNQKNGETNEEINLSLMSQKIIARNMNLSSSEYVFQSPHSLRGGLGEFRKAFDIVKKEANLETSIHCLRHTFCTNVARKCKSSFRLRQLTRHKTESGIKPYLHLMPNDAMEDIELASIGTEQSKIASTIASIRLVASP